MLEIRPTCEHCSRPLPPESLEARVCSFECTFCADCAIGLLGNVCPNCGGGFVPRPIRPARNWMNNNSLGSYPATETITHKPVDLTAHAQLCTALNHLPPQKR